MNSNNLQSLVLVVDDDEAMRDSVCCLLEIEKIPCKMFASAQDFLEFDLQLQSGCILLDIRMPGIDGMELLQNLMDQGSQLPVVIITGHGDVSLAVRAMKLGAFDFVEKPFKARELLDRVYAALQSNQESRSDNLKQDFLRNAFDVLTSREKQIMELVVLGSSSKAISFRLGISAKTVDTHRASIMRKLDVRNIAELVQKRMALLDEK